MVKGQFLLIFILLTLWFSQCARILGVFPTPAISHYILGSTLMKALAEKGHDVTVISVFAEKDPPKAGTYRNVIVKNVNKKMGNMFGRNSPNPFRWSFVAAKMIAQYTSNILNDENVKKLISSKEQFDVVIVEQFVNDHHKALATHFKAPLIIFSGTGTNFWTDPLVGNPSPPSYVPDVMLAYPVPMSLYHRFINILKTIFNYLLYYLVVFPGQNDLIRATIPEKPNLDDVLYNASIVLLNSHPSIHQPVPYVPNMIDIGGFHLKPPKKLPEGLQKFLDDAKVGVIYFSMGSILKSANLPVEKREILMKTFSNLKQQILWKWEEDVLPGQPPNVKLGKWLPQQDILAHPNVKLFINHGGLMSTMESIYHGIPVLAIPIFGDNQLNAMNVVNKGYGLSLNYDDISEETLNKNIEEILSNPRFKQNAERGSRIFLDRLISPMDTAIYWIEYVIRHKGAPHLRVAGLDLPWYKYLLLDVIAFLAALGIGILYILYYVMKIIHREFLSKKRISRIVVNCIK